MIFAGWSPARLDQPRAHCEQASRSAARLEQASSNGDQGWPGPCDNRPAGSSLRASSPKRSKAGTYWKSAVSRLAGAQPGWASRELTASRPAEAQQGWSVLEACCEQAGWSPARLGQPRAHCELASRSAARLEQASSNGDEGCLRPCDAGPAGSSLRASPPKRSKAGAGEQKWRPRLPGALRCGPAESSLRASSPKRSKAGTCWKSAVSRLAGAQPGWASRELTASKLAEAQQGWNILEVCCEQAGWSPARLGQPRAHCEPASRSAAGLERIVGSLLRAGWLEPGQAGPAESSLRAG